MVQARTRNRQCDLSELSASQRREMLHGRGWFSDDALSSGDMWTAWALHRESLQAEWREKFPPGTRCFAEWLCEIIPKHGERPTTAYFQQNHKRTGFLKHGILHTHCWPAMQEPEREFLFRHGVIDEVEYLDAKALYDADHEGEATR